MAAKSKHTRRRRVLLTAIAGPESRAVGQVAVAPMALAPVAVTPVAVAPVSKVVVSINDVLEAVLRLAAFRKQLAAAREYLSAPLLFEIAKSVATAASPDILLASRKWLEDRQAGIETQTEAVALFEDEFTRLSKELIAKYPDDAHAFLSDRNQKLEAELATSEGVEKEIIEAQIATVKALLKTSSSDSQTGTPRGAAATVGGSKAKRSANKKRGRK